MLCFFSDTNHLHVKTAHVGETVHVQCGGVEKLNSSVNWRYQAQLDTKSRPISSGANLTNGDFGGRLKVTKTTLIISDLKAGDNGIYICIENLGSGPQHRVRLSVHGKLR